MDIDELENIEDDDIELSIGEKISKDDKLKKTIIISSSDIVVQSIETNIDNLFVSNDESNNNKSDSDIILMDVKYSDLLFIRPKLKPRKDIIIIRWANSRSTLFLNIYEKKSVV